MLGRRWPADGASWTNTASAQSRALSWLSTNTGLTNQTLTTTVQRYVLATLYYSTSGQLWNQTAGWMTDTPECLWFTFASNDICTLSGNLKIINLNNNRLGGTIPPELGLLSDSLGKHRMQYLEDHFFFPSGPGIISVSLSRPHWICIHIAICTCVYVFIHSRFLTCTHSRPFLFFFVSLHPPEIINLSQNPDVGGTIPTEFGRLTNTGK